MIPIEKLIAYEQGALSPRDTLELFSELIKSGQAWSLQGSYGRAAKSFIDAEWIDVKGNINWELYNEQLGE